MTVTRGMCAALAALCALMVGQVYGCASSGRSTTKSTDLAPTVWGVQPSPPSLKGQLPRANLLARGFLPRGGASPKGYAAYVYLLFADNTNQSVGSRRVASAAFLTLLQHVADVQNLGIAPDRMALFIAPVVSRNAAFDLKKSPDPNDLLAKYDYTRARLLMQNIEKKVQKNLLPQVSLVLTSTQLDGQGSIYPVNAAKIIDLDNVSPNEAARRIVALKNELQDLNVRDGIAASRAVAFFTRLGCAVMSVQQVIPSPLGPNATTTDACGH